MFEDEGLSLFQHLFTTNPAKAGSGSRSTRGSRSGRRSPIVDDNTSSDSTDDIDDDVPRGRDAFTDGSEERSGDGAAAGDGVQRTSVFWYSLRTSQAGSAVIHRLIR